MAKDTKTLTVSLTAEVAGLRRGMDQARGHLKNFEKSASTTANVVKTAFAVFAGGFLLNKMEAGIRGAVGAFNETRGMIENTKHLADALGSTTEEIQSIRKAAELAEVPIESLDKNLKFMTKSLGAASMGTGPAVEHLDNLGLSAQTLIHMPLGQQLEAIAGGMSQLQTQAQRAAVAAAFFGKSGIEMLPFLDNAADDIAELRQEMGLTGELFSSEDAAKVDNMGDAMNRLFGVITALKVQFTIQLAPAIQYVTELFKGMAISAGGARPMVEGWINKLVNGAAMFADGIQTAYSWAVRVAGVIGSLFGDTLTGDFTRIQNLFSTMVSGLKIGLLEALAAFSRGIQNLIDSMFDKETSLGAVINDIMDTMLGRPAYQVGRQTDVAGPTDTALANARKEFAASSADFTGGSMFDGWADEISKGSWGDDIKKFWQDAQAGGVTQAEIAKQMMDDTFDILPALEKEKALRESVTGELEKQAELSKETGEFRSMRDGEGIAFAGRITGGGGLVASAAAGTTSGAANGAAMSGNARTGPESSITILQGILNAANTLVAQGNRQQVAVVG